ncbi:conjugal transfer relaxase TraI [Alcanivorax hongdengensis A-11-3]|uniref:Conjugal transfer relaxase TraI n=1 Tax=Alcanivorax hongdengensis A-11-3 TaxID=1177179 RepID=L0W8Y6_9GAMM|nr:TraI/MobA(P) family conjugative relaxase [Alcanivorax hongdengensis]EKF73381.1 conjugal transfer relaxase TraI [Alcanivorax hongdengensis A-11-3]
MIAKHVPMRSLKKSDFAGLVKYITDEQSKTERLGLVNATNCEADTMQAVIGEVLATQQANTRAKGDKTYHLIVSFPAGEKPEDGVLKAVEERICAGLGYADHQRVSAVHHDTDNVHIHIAINKIHPTRNTMHEPYQAYRTLGGLCDALEDEYGLQKDNHQGRKSVSQGRASDMERHAGIESLVSWIKRECLEEIRTAKTWEELHQVMGDNGLEIRQRANGFVIESEDGTQVKASTVARDLSKPKLEARLGAFEETEAQAERKAKRRYDKRPTRFKVNTTELYARYQEEQKNLTAARKVEWDNARGRKDRRIEAAKRSNRLRRSAIKLMGGDRLSKKLLYAQAHKALKDEIQSINKEHKRERQELYEQYKRRAWADWLKQQALDGDKKALEALRAREQAKGLQGDTIKGEGGAKPGHAPVTDNITKKGTIIFRTASSAVRDDGDKLQVSKAATGDAVTEALRMAMERYGNRITVNGSPQFKAQVIHAAATSNLPITFADAGLERRRQQLLQQENSHDRRNEQARRGNERGRADRRGTGRPGRGAADDAGRGRGAADSRAAGASRTGGGQRGRGPSAGTGSAAAGRRNDAGNGGRHVLNKPHVTGIGGEPPSFAKNRLRALSSLGVVRFARGGEVLLPGNVPGELEHQGAKPDNQLRWGVSGSGGIAADKASAADKYIAEREAKRLKGFDIPKHSRYTNQDGAVTYGGTRNVQGQSLALLNRGDEVLVLPIDKATAQRMKRVRIGEAVTVTPQGSLKRSRGRSR